MTRLLLAVAGLSLAGCQTTTPTMSRSCLAASSSDWQAWVNAMPGPNAQPKLIATGKVTVPTGGYTYRWGGLRVMESYPVQVSVQLILVPPNGPATQAAETIDVRGEWLASPPIGSFTVTCGDMTLGRVSPVETAH